MEITIRVSFLSFDSTIQMFSISLSRSLLSRKSALLVNRVSEYDRACLDVYHGDARFFVGM